MDGVSWYVDDELELKKNYFIVLVSFGGICCFFFKYKIDFIIEKVELILIFGLILLMLGII